MSFRQFPATAANGESYIIIEFKSEHADAPTQEPTFRYELEDGRHLHRQGARFVTEDGQLSLSLA